MMHLTPSFIKTDKFDNLFSDLTCLNLALYTVTTVLTASSILGSTWGMFHKAMWASFFIPFIFALYYFLRGKFSYIECVLYALLILLCIYIRKNTGYGNHIVFTVYTIVCRFVDKDKFLKTGFWSLLISLLFVFAVALIFGIQGNNAEHFRYGEMKTRYGIGFGYTTFPPNFYLSIVIFSVFAIKKWLPIHYILLLAGAIILFILTDTKSPFICSILMIVLILMKNISKSSIIIKLISKFNIILFALGTAVIWIMSALYTPQNSFLAYINKITTGRLALTANGFKIWGVSLFGQKPDFSKGAEVFKHYTYVDSSYMQTLFNCGIVFLVIVIVVFTVMAYIAYKLDDKNLIIALFVLGVHAILDPQLIVVSYNPLCALGLYYAYKYKNFLIIKNER